MCVPETMIARLAARVVLKRHLRLDDRTGVFLRPSDRRLSKLRFALRFVSHVGREAVELELSPKRRPAHPEQLG
jgi:hypothetical protein